MSSVSESRSKRKLEEKKKKKSSVTVWSEEDDISLLKGMIDYKVLNHSSPYANMGMFLDFVKPSLHFDIQRKQLTDRLWKLKNRFLNSNYDVSKPHHAKLFELSKSIKPWKHHGNVSLDGDKSENVVVTGDDGNGEDDNAVVGDVDVDKSSKVVQNKKKGKLGTSGVRDGENDNVVVGDVDIGKLSKVAKDKEKRKLVTGDVVDGQKNNVFLDDVDGSKRSKVVKYKKSRKVVIGDGLEDDNGAVDYAKKNGKKRVEVLGIENVPGEVNREDLEYITSKYPNLMNMLELETLSRMPQHIKKNCVIDTIKYMGRGKANKLEEKGADLRLMELELHAKKLDLTNKQINLILEVARR